jgi:hypothetical protein
MNKVIVIYENDLRQIIFHALLEAAPENTFEYILNELSKKSRTTFSPDEETARMAPAAICSVLQRIVLLRQMIENGELKPEVAEKLGRIVAPVAFEAELTSGKMGILIDAMKKTAMLQV